MAKQLDDLRTDVRLEIGSPSAGRLSDAQINDRINYSYQEMATRFRHPEIEKSRTVNTVADTKTISLALDHWYTKTIKDEDNNRVLLYRPIMWILTQQDDGEGQPRYFTRYGSTLILFPTPAAVYNLTHYYISEVTPLAADSDTTVFDNIAWDEIVKWGTVWRGFQTMGEQDRMIHARNIWRTLINNMPETEVLTAEKSFQVAAPMYNEPVPGHE